MVTGAIHSFPTVSKGRVEEKGWGGGKTRDCIEEEPLSVKSYYVLKEYQGRIC